MNTLAHRLLAGHLAIVLVLACTLGAAWWSALEVQAGYTHTVRVSDALIDATSTRIKLRDDEETGLRGYLLTNERKFLQPYAAAKAELPAAVAKSKQFAAQEAGSLRYLLASRQAGTAWERWADGMLSRHRGAGGGKHFLTEMNTGKYLFDRYRLQTARMLAFLRARRNQELRAADLTVRVTFTVLLIVFIGGLGAVLMIARLTTRSITRPIRELSDIARHIGEGDLGRFNRVESAVEFNRLSDEMDHMRQQLVAQRDELHRLNRELFEQARRDPLTGAWNRLRLQEDLDALHALTRRYGRPYSIAICDVDHFKRYNDHYGHAGGDDVLRRVAQVLRSASRESDAVYRYGGEEFVIVLPEQSLTGGITAAEKLRAAVEGLQIPHDGIQPTGVVTVSVGVASSEHQMERTPEEIWKCADVALYRAKSAGRNRVEYTPHAA